MLIENVSVLVKYDNFISNFMHWFDQNKLFIPIRSSLWAIDMKLEIELTFFYSYLLSLSLAQGSEPLTEGCD